MNYINYNNEKVIPSKIVCVGRNYVDHIKELDNEIPENIVIFNKPNSAISKKLKIFNEHIRYEGEISFLIKNEQIEAVGFGLDLTKIEVQNNLKNKGLPWEKSKAFDNSAVFSNFISFDRTEIEKLSMKLFINNKLVQEANYNLMINKPQSMLENIKEFMSLEDGDIIMTGTPKGVGSYKIGDDFTAQIFCDKNLILEENFIAS